MKAANVTKTGRVLIIAGSDCSGGAGIQADLKTLTRFGVYGSTAITAITVQNTKGVYAIHPVPVAIIEGQIKAVIDDIGVDAVKIGMLGRTEVIHAVADMVAGLSIPIIVDPVMVATSGARLLEDEAVAALIARLLPLATVLTPNIPEAETLTGMPIRTEADMLVAADIIKNLTSASLVMKGGHLKSDALVDLLITDKAVFRHTAVKIATRSTHGTGCTFASALAAGMAKHGDIRDAFGDAHRFVQSAIRQAPGLGQGSGPIDHLTAVLR